MQRRLMRRALQGGMPQPVRRTPPKANEKAVLGRLPGVLFRRFRCVQHLSRMIAPLKILLTACDMGVTEKVGKATIYMRLVVHAADPEVVWCF